MSTKRVHRERILYRGRTFTVVRETVRLRNGKRMVVEYYRRPPSVVVIPLLDRRRVVMTVERRAGRGGKVWGVVAGHVERGERRHPAAAARRELREEAGYRAASLRLLWVSQPSSSVRWQRYVYLATGLTPVAKKPRRDEAIATKIIPVDAACQLALAGKIPNETAALALLRLRHKFGRASGVKKT